VEGFVRWAWPGEALARCWLLRQLAWEGSDFQLRFVVVRAIMPSRAEEGDQDGGEEQA
jgi:hypothetical protein